MLAVAVTLIAASTLAILTGGETGRRQTEINRQIDDPVYPGSTFEVILDIRAESRMTNMTVIEDTENLTVISSPSGTIHNTSISWYLKDIEGNHTVKYTAKLPPSRYKEVKITGRFENDKIKREITGEKEVEIAR